MSDESYEPVAGPEAEAKATEEKPGKKKKKETPSLKEQIHQLRYFFLLLILGGLGYGAYYLHDYMYVKPFMLADQFGKQYEVTLSEKPTVFMVVQGDQSQILPWAGRIVPMTLKGDIEGHGIMDLSSVELNFHGVARGRVQEATKQPVLLDFDGIVFADIRPIPEVLNIIIVAPGGRILKHITGAWSEESWAEFQAAVGTPPPSESTTAEDTEA